MYNDILAEDINTFSLPDQIVDSLKNRTIIITGATGLIGSTLVKCILSLSLNTKLILPVRDKVKALKILTNSENLEIVENNITDFFNNYNKKADYVIHCASPTNGIYMKNHPVETFNFIYESTQSILEYAQRNNLKSSIFLSSIEYYGELDTDIPVTENMTGYMDLTNPRNAYALGKRAAEFLCHSYFLEFGTKIKIARLTQTLGAGISSTDNRVFAQFARSIIHNKNIILHTEGLSSKPYCYTTDAISAILTILIKGNNGESYNVSTPGTYISIRDLAIFLINNFNPNIDIEFQIQKDNGYAPMTKINMCSDKLIQLGWNPKHNLLDMFNRLIKSLS